MIFHRYIEYRKAPKWFWVPIIEREEFQEKIENIAKISAIYWFGTDKSTFKSVVKWRAEQRGRTEKKLLTFSGFFENFENSQIWIFDDLMTQISLVFLYYHFILYHPFIFNTFHIYLINLIFKNYYHFTLNLFIYCFNFI